MKLRNLHIENYKMFKDFDISFVDKNNEALPIVVLAGVNGSGKTSLLEYVYNFLLNIQYKNSKSSIVFEIQKNVQKKIYVFNNEILSMAIKSEYKVLETYPFKFKDYFFYFSANIDLKPIKELLPEYLRKIVWDEDIKASEAFKRVKDFSNSIFKDLNIDMEFDSRDGKGNLYFRNKSGGNKFLIDELSTGEKILISKVLYLYLEDIKDKVILIDEPELSLHPLWQKRVLKIYENFAKKNNCQIIIATHSPHIIASAKNKYLRFLVKEDNKIVVKQLTNSPLDRDTNTILKTIMGANYIPKELEELHLEYRKLVDSGEVESQEAKKVKEKILEFESPNSSFFQGIAFDLELM